ncbi:MAG: hypothetical protein JOZ15_00250 [Acidobacteria bacterium]|nr:hypothetical protein [Acidobacteriota bacterium]
MTAATAMTATTAMAATTATAATTAGSTTAGSGAAAAGAGDPELMGEARSLLASLADAAAGAANNLGVELIAAGQLDRAEATLVRAAAMAPGQPAPRGSLALCWFQRAKAARRGGATTEAERLFAASRDGYRQAVHLAEAAGRADLAALYGRGLAAAAAEINRD